MDGYRLAGRRGSAFDWSVLQQREQPPTDEVYTQALPFQIASFAFSSLPYWIGALLIILIIEFATFGRKAP